MSTKCDPAGTRAEFLRGFLLSYQPLQAFLIIQMRRKKDIAKNCQELRRFFWHRLCAQEQSCGGELQIEDGRDPDLWPDPASRAPNPLSEAHKILLAGARLQKRSREQRDVGKRSAGNACRSRPRSRYSTPLVFRS